MKAVVAVLMMLFRVSHGVGPSCDGRQNGTQCFGTLGGSVDLKLMENASETTKFSWKKNMLIIIINWRNNKRVDNTTDSRLIFVSTNGTVRINNLSRNDSGKYEASYFNTNGYIILTTFLQLFVEAPVSSVQLVPECLSQGQIKVSCLSKGDSPQYKWTLDGQTLTDSELFPRNITTNNETNIIVLRRDTSGHLVCSVNNQVSNSTKMISLTNCAFVSCTSNGTEIAKWVYEKEHTLCDEMTTIPSTVRHTTVGKETQSNTSTSSPGNNDQPLYIQLLKMMVGVFGALLLILVVSMGFIYAHKKKKNSKVSEDDQEMTYADVRIVKKQERKVQKSAEAEVEYGQVKFSKKPRLDQSNATVDDTVYAQVRKGR